MFQKTFACIRFGNDPCVQLISSHQKPHLDPNIRNFAFYYRGFLSRDFPLRFLILNEFDICSEIT